MLWDLGLYLIAAIMGSVLGSYLTAVFYRIPRNIPLGGRSFCPNCNTPLKTRYNTPILGWVFLRGRSGCCQTKIPARYVLFELSMAMLFIGLLTISCNLAIVVWVIIFMATILWALIKGVSLTKAPLHEDDNHDKIPS